MRRLGSVLSLFALAISTPASAFGPVHVLGVGPWSGGSFFVDATGRFSHCAAGRTLSNGLTLSINVQREHVWGFIVGNTAWKPAPGAAQPVDLTFDGSHTLHLYAKVSSNIHVAILMPETEAAVDFLRGARRMTMFGNGLAYEFDLPQTSQLYDALLDCMHTHLNTSTQPVIGSRPTAPRPLNNDAAVERAKLLSDAAKEHGQCLATQMRQIVPYSNENAETLAQVVITKCEAAEEKYVQLGIAIFNTSRADIQKVVTDVLEKRKKQLVADIVSFRADLARSRLAPPKTDANPDQIPKNGGI